MRKLLLFLVLFSGSVQGVAAPAKGDPAPQVIGTNVEGVALETGQYRGKVLVVTFWATWCGPCMRELPMLESMQRLAGKDHLQVVAVNIEDGQVFRKVAKKLASFQLTLAHDERKRGTDAYGVNGIPHMVIIGRDGTILKVNRGYSEEALDGILAEINAALKPPA
jgi:thiol-disulfide isomerase/thioredoxin